MSHQIGFIGLGRMGKNMVLHLVEQQIKVVGYNRTQGVTEGFTKEVSSNFFIPAHDISSLVSKLQTPRVVFLMVPNGEPVDEVIGRLLASGLSKGDTVIDGGNCFYKDSVRRQGELKSKGVHFIDCGTSGGLEGARNGACLMLGGDKDVVMSLKWLWDSISTSCKGSTLTSKGSALSGGSWEYFGPAGAGHFVKMIHNGVEYGMNQAIAEGFEILEKGPYNLDFAKVATNWSRGSVVRGWLIELLAKAFENDPKLADYEGIVGGGQTGKWTVDAADAFGVEAQVLNDALIAREKSQTKPTFAGKVVSALRAGYGGHKEPR